MLYEFAHWLRAQMPWIWEVTEVINDKLFVARFGRRMKCCSLLKLSTSALSIRWVAKNDIEDLVAFFERQPVSNYNFFTPHAFDRKTLENLNARHSFMMFIVRDNQEIVGYGFVRGICNGSGYLGKMVDAQHQGHGIGTLLVSIGMDVCAHLGIRMFETISEGNPASMATSQKACRIKKIKKVKNGDWLIEDFPKDDKAK